MIRSFRFIALTMFVMAFATIATFGQVQFSFPIHVQGATATDTGTVVVGVNEGVNTYAPDLSTSLGEWRERLSPPASPAGWDFWVGFFDIPNQTEIGTISAGTGMRPNDFRGFISSADVDTFNIRVTGNNVPNGNITITWPANLNTNLLNARLLRKVGTNWNSVVSDMLISTNYIQDNSGGNSTYNFLLIFQPKSGGVGIRTEDATKSLPEKFEVGQNYPNPFNPTTKISYSVKELSHVRIAVYNLLGQEVATLINRELAAGRYTVDWSGMDSKESSFSAGIYFYRMTAGSFIETKKMIMVK